MQTNVSKTCSGQSRKMALSELKHKGAMHSDFLNYSYRQVRKWLNYSVFHV